MKEHYSHSTTLLLKVLVKADKICDGMLSRCRSLSARRTGEDVSISDSIIEFVAIILTIVLHRASKKLCKLIFCSLSVKCEPISIKNWKDRPGRNP